MKRALLVPSSLFVAAVALAAQADVVARLGSTMTEAQGAIFSAFSGGNVPMIGTAGVFKTADAQTRVALVAAVVNLARSYSTSDDFARRYAQFREYRKPAPPEAPASAEAMQDEMRKGMDEAIRGLEEAAKANPQMKKDIDAQIAEMRKQMAAMTADTKKNAELDAMLKEGAAEQAAVHKLALAEWEKKYPVDPKGLIAARLREFLELSATVDFNATVTKSTGKNPVLRFDNPAYERRDRQWKYMYRAGKPAVDAARALAQEWLTALGG